MSAQNRAPTSDSRKARSQPSDDRPQAAKFADLARELECDEDQEAFDERLKKVAKTQAEPSKPTQARK